MNQDFQAYKSEHVHLLSPSQDEIVIEDVAHSLFAAMPLPGPHRRFLHGGTALRPGERDGSAHETPDGASTKTGQRSILVRSARAH